MNDASFSDGCMIFRAQISVKNLIDERKAEKDGGQKKYQEFIIHDIKNKKIIKSSCSPDSISPYGVESDLPYHISPVFFNPEVLYRYKSNSEKYCLEERSISCRNSWHLKTYDINDAGQVHTYIRYLSFLPYEEQTYWHSFNEKPKGNISKRAMENDFLGQVSSETDHLISLRRVIESLNMSNKMWWKKRSSVIEKINYPVTDSIDEWSSEISSLYLLIVEGFSQRGLLHVPLPRSHPFRFVRSHPSGSLGATHSGS